MTLSFVRGVANIEGVNFLKTQKLLSLSEQELDDCDKKIDCGEIGFQNIDGSV